LFQTVLARPSVQGEPPNLVLAGVAPMTVSDKVPPYLILARSVRFAISC